MLFHTTVQLAIVGLAGAATANSNVCKRFPYAQIALFSKVPEVQSFCSAKYPLARCTTTSTSTVYETVPTTVATETVVTDISTVFEVVGTDYVFSTLTDEAVTVTTTTATSTQTVYTDTTVTEFTRTMISCTSTIGITKRSALPEVDSTPQPKPLDLSLRKPVRRSATDSTVKRFNRHMRARSPPLIQGRTPNWFKAVASTTSTSTTSVTATVSSQATTTLPTSVTVIEYVVPTTVVSVQATSTTTMTSTTNVQAVATDGITCGNCYGPGLVCEGGYKLQLNCSFRTTVEARKTTIVPALSVYACGAQCGARGAGVCEVFIWDGNDKVCTLYAGVSGGTAVPGFHAKWVRGIVVGTC